MPLNREHYNLVLKSLTTINKANIKNILDAGSGRTSLNILITIFPDANIDAIVYYNDQRKINSIKENVKGNYNLIQADICKDNIDLEYDLILAHLLLGESEKWGNSTKKIIDSLSNIKTKYLLIFDYKEDPIIDYEYLEKYLNNKYELINKSEKKLNEPQKFNDFVGRTYSVYLYKINRKDN